MGLANALMELGIQVEAAVVAFGTRSGKVPLQWPATKPPQTPGLVYRLPRDPHQRASIFATVQTIVVNDGELAVVLEDGRSNGQLPPGRYVFERRRVVGSLDIVWIRTGQQAIKWGIPPSTSQDNVQVSANGVIYVRVTDGERFNRDVVQGATAMSEPELQRFLMPRIQSVLRTVIPRFQALELQAQRELFQQAIRSALTEPLDLMGISIVEMEVIDIGLPAEFKAVIQQATLAQHAGRADLIQATTAAQVKQLEAQAAAQALLLQGGAQVQVMAQMQAQGIDPLRFKALEALEVMAENPSQGLGSDAARSNLFGGVALAALATPSPPAGAPPVLLPPAPVPPAPAVESEAELQRQLDALDQRLAEGKISEETYRKVADRLEARLAQLKGPR